MIRTDAVEVSISMRRSVRLLSPAQNRVNAHAHANAPRFMHATRCISRPLFPHCIGLRASIDLLDRIRAHSDRRCECIRRDPSPEAMARVDDRLIPAIAPSPSIGKSSAAAAHNSAQVRNVSSTDCRFARSRSARCAANGRRRAQASSAQSAAASAWMRAVSNSGTSASPAPTSRPISVQPRMTPCAPRSIRSVMIAR